MQLEVINLKTNHIMYAWFPCKEDAKSTLSFYRSYRENGSKKYSVKIISNERIKVTANVQGLQ